MELLPQKNIPQTTRQILRRKTKNFKLFQAKIIYVCECSKIYLSYPSLYLHAKNKHQMKLSSKFNQQMCRKIKKRGKIYFQFFFSPCNSENKLQQYSNFPKDVLIQEQFLKTGSLHDKSSANVQINSLDSFPSEKDSLKRQLNLKALNIRTLAKQYIQGSHILNIYKSKLTETVLSTFVEYIEKLMEFSNEHLNRSLILPENMIESLPLFLNEFILYYLPLRSQLSFENPIRHEEVQVMKMFADWLREQNFTNLLVLKNF